MRRYIALFLIALLLIPGYALAELQRGDQGDDVRELQQLLFEAGFLFELPDGIFGRATEDALKWFQEYAQLEQTGVAGDAELDALHVCLSELNGAPEANDGHDEFEGDAPSCCQRYLTEEGDEHIELCGRHALLDADETLPGHEKWEAELMALYEEWLAVSPEENHASILSSRSFFLLWLEQQRQAFEAQEVPDMEQRLTDLLRSQCADICSILPTE